MKNIVASIAAIVFLLSVSTCYAVTREAQYNLEDQSNVGQLGVSGSSQTGNPGYIALSSPDLNGALFTYYLWINGSGKACIASYPVISTYSSFPSGNWNNRIPGMGCTVVGSQS